ncbi:MAG: molybdopterin-dependent oxidoreductase [Acetobacteraceae bacterium]|nr:molybdopterin-dependent oxidoreductase [Acetobacteraceae bacterium]
MPDRRSVLRAAGALVLGFAVPLPARGQAAAPALTAYLRIARDGRITLLSPTTELGQGTWTAHAVIIADELGADPRRIAVQNPHPAAPFRRDVGTAPAMSSGGSWGVRYWVGPLRTAAARARTMLIAAAALRLGVPASELVAEDHQVLHRATGRAIGFGDLAEAAAERRVPDSVQLKPHSELRLIGKGMPRLDVPAKTRGATTYGIDLRLPGMAYACAKLNPVFRGDIETWDEAPARAIPGVLGVVRIEGGVAVAAETMWAAMRGAEALPATWKATPHDTLSSAAVSAGMREALGAPQAVVARGWGDAAEALRGAARMLDATYEVPFLAHTPMEPFNVTASITGEWLELWAPTQAQDRLVNRVVRDTGWDRARIRLHTMQPGGAYGRRLHEDIASSAVTVARALGRPVKLFWDRASEIGQGWYRPAQMARLKAALDGQGRLTALLIRTAGTSLLRDVTGREAALDRTAVQTLDDTRYRVPNYMVDTVRRQVAVPSLFWRGVGATQNGFFLECFLDEVAQAAARDPVELRRELLAHDPRALKVINLAAEKSGWATPARPGRARGFAFVFSYGSLCAQVAEVSMADGRPRVHRITCVLDCGAVVLPDAVRAQIEGAVTQGVSAAMGEAVRIAAGRATNTNFDTYPILRMDEQPVIAAHIVESTEAMGGVGEPPLPPVAPAVANAFSRLAGRRIRMLPILDALRG